MEISKGLQEEIVSVQNKLKNAIRDHQICVGKLKDDPNNTDILGQIQQIQLQIVSLGKCQKQVVQRLRKEVEAFQAENKNGAKISVASLLGLNNNDRITNNNETKCKPDDRELDRKPAMEYYEDVVQNGNVSSLAQSTVSSKARANSVETVSGEDDVIEVSMDENSNEKQESREKDYRNESSEKLNFLCALGLITTGKYAELQNKRVERKRRSTANPQFVYSSLEMPTKRKRHSYLQSICNAPLTRQTTARLNGPSPPPNKSSPPTKSSSPPVTKTTTTTTTTTTSKSLIPVQKPAGRPNILRNVAENKVPTGKQRTECEPTVSQARLPVSNAKPVQQSTTSKTVHIPGLPSGLTIERIESDSIVCINCRNPGTLTVCEHCSSSYHVSCHSVSPAPPRTCPKCVSTTAEEDVGSPSYKKDEELEEKERERYELRERNSDLRLQVYELEKRSQLLSQSLQLQQRMRQELLGKQEKTQKSIKRLVDFIKLMQLTKTSSPPHSGSDNCHPQPSSSQSRQTSQPHCRIRIQSRPRDPQRVASPNHIRFTTHYPPRPPPITSNEVTSSSSNCHRVPHQPSSTPRLKPESRTPTICQSQGKKNYGRILLSRKSQSRIPDETVTSSSSRSQVSTINSRPSARRRSPSPAPPSFSTSESPRSGKRIRKESVPSTSASWNGLQSSTVGSRSSVNHVQKQALTACHPEPRKSSCPTTTWTQVRNRVQSPVQSLQRRVRPSDELGPDSQVPSQPVVSSTRCSQAITSPIPSATAIRSREYKVTKSSKLHSNDSRDQEVPVVSVSQDLPLTQELPSRTTEGLTPSTSTSDT